MATFEMMASMPQGFQPHPGGMQQAHPNMPPGHHMAPGMAHNPSQPGAQPGGIPPHLAQQMGVSAPGAQVNPSALMGMPGPNAHAMQHLNPQVQHMFGQQPVNMNCESGLCAGGPWCVCVLPLLIVDRPSHRATHPAATVTGHPAPETTASNVGAANGLSDAGGHADG